MYQHIVLTSHIKYETELLSQASPCFCLFEEEYRDSRDNLQLDVNFYKWSTGIPQGVSHLKREHGLPRKVVERSGTRGYRVSLKNVVVLETSY